MASDFLQLRWDYAHGDTLGSLVARMANDMCRAKIYYGVERIGV